MKKAILALTLALTVCSCQLVYQVSTVESDNVKKTGDTFMFEDSLARIDYKLWSYGGKLQFNIYNKTSVPLYIDWNKSNFIYKGYSFDYWKDEYTSSTLTAATSTKNKYYKNVSEFNAASVSIVEKQKPQVQLPPHAYITLYKFNLNQPFYTDKKDEILPDKKLSYTKENTPLLFRNYLAISKNQNYSDAVFIDNSFWIAEINNYNEQAFRSTVSSSNAFFTKTQTGKGTGAMFGIFAGVLIFFVVLIVATP